MYAYCSMCHICTNKLVALATSRVADFQVPFIKVHARVRTVIPLYVRILLYVSSYSAIYVSSYYYISLSTICFRRCSWGRMLTYADVCRLAGALHESGRSGTRLSRPSGFFFSHSVGNFFFHSLGHDFRVLQVFSRILIFPRTYSCIFQNSKSFVKSSCSPSHPYFDEYVVASC